MPSRNILIEKNLLARFMESIPWTAVLGKTKEVNTAGFSALLENTAVGDICQVKTRIGCVLALASGHSAVGAKFSLVADNASLAPGAAVINPGTGGSVLVPFCLKGQILNCLGQPLRKTSGPNEQIEINLYNPPPSPLKRIPISDMFHTGVNSLDAFCTLGTGQRLGLFAEAGTGKSSLLGMIARNSAADINVIALIGERGREVGEFVTDALGADGKSKSVLVVSTSNESSTARKLAALTAMSISEYYRDQGKKVLLLFDSLTRYCRALREIGLENGELPVRQGYTPSVFTELPKLLERAGKTKKGSITAIFTVLSNQALDIDPLAEEIKSLLDGHIVLSKNLLEAGYCPALDINASVSRCFNKLHGQKYLTAVGRLRRLLNRLKQDKDLLLFGGTADSELKEALELEPKLKTLLSQGFGPGLPPVELFEKISRL